MLDTFKIEDALKTEYLGRNIFVFDSVVSTNTEAVRLAQDNAAPGTIVLAEQQTGGKGRLGRSWYNTSGLDICMSIILRPAFKTANASRLVLATAVGLHSLISQYGLRPKIKWPNDVLVRGRKISGILMEIQGDINTLDYVIVGMGINVNNLHFNDGICAAATSLALELGHDIDRNKFVSELLYNLETVYEACKSEQGFNAIAEKYKKNCETLNKTVDVRIVDGVKHGTAIGLDSEGRLLLESDDGTVSVVTAGDIIAG